VLGDLGGVPPEAAPLPRLRAAGALLALVPLERVAVLRLEAAAARAGVRVVLVRLAELAAGRAGGVVVAAGVVTGVGVAGAGFAGVAEVLVVTGVSGVGVAADAAGGATLPAPAAGVDPAVMEPVRAEGAVRVRRAMVRRGEGSWSGLGRVGISRRVPRNR
jgi:hypothetical protein